MTIHLDINNRGPITLELGLRVRNDVLRDLLKLFKQGGQYYWDKLCFLLLIIVIIILSLKAQVNCVELRVCVCVYVNSSLSSHFVEFKTYVFFSLVWFKTLNNFQSSIKLCQYVHKIN